MNLHPDLPWIERTTDFLDAADGHSPPKEIAHRQLKCGLKSASRQRPEMAL